MTNKVINGKLLDSAGNVHLDNISGYLTKTSIVVEGEKYGLKNIEYHTAIFVFEYDKKKNRKQREEFDYTGKFTLVFGEEGEVQELDISEIKEEGNGLLYTCTNYWGTEVSNIEGVPDVSFLGLDRGYEWDLDSIYEGLGISKYLQTNKEGTRS